MFATRHSQCGPQNKGRQSCMVSRSRPKKKEYEKSQRRVWNQLWRTRPYSGEFVGAYCILSTPAKPVRDRAGTEQSGRVIPLVISLVYGSPLMNIQGVITLANLAGSRLPGVHVGRLADIPASIFLSWYLLSGRTSLIGDRKDPGCWFSFAIMIMRCFQISPISVSNFLSEDSYEKRAFYHQSFYVWLSMTAFCCT